MGELAYETRCSKCSWFMKPRSWLLSPLFVTEVTDENSAAETGKCNAIGEENIFMAKPVVGAAIDDALVAAAAWIQQCGTQGEATHL